MADENTVDYPALCEELSARVAELEVALTEEQDKNAVLVQQGIEAEDNIHEIFTLLRQIQCDIASIRTLCPHHEKQIDEMGNRLSKCEEVINLSAKSNRKGSSARAPPALIQ